MAFNQQALVFPPNGTALVARDQTGAASVMAPAEYQGAPAVVVGKLGHEKALDETITTEYRDYIREIVPLNEHWECLVLHQDTRKSMIGAFTRLAERTGHSFDQNRSLYTLSEAQTSALEDVDVPMFDKKPSALAEAETCKRMMLSKAAGVVFESISAYPSLRGGVFVLVEAADPNTELPPTLVLSRTAHSPVLRRAGFVERRFDGLASSLRAISESSHAGTRIAVVGGNTGQNRHMEKQAKRLGYRVIRHDRVFENSQIEDGLRSIKESQQRIRLRTPVLNLSNRVRPHSYFKTLFTEGSDVIREVLRGGEYWSQAARQYFRKDASPMISESDEGLVVYLPELDEADRRETVAALTEEAALRARALSERISSSRLTDAAQIGDESMTVHRVEATGSTEAITRLRDRVVDSSFYSSRILGISEGVVDGRMSIVFDVVSETVWSGIKRAAHEVMREAVRPGAVTFNDLAEGEKVEDSSAESAHVMVDVEQGIVEFWWENDSNEIASAPVETFSDIYSAVRREYPDADVRVVGQQNVTVDFGNADAALVQKAFDWISDRLDQHGLPVTPHSDSKDAPSPEELELESVYPVGRRAPRITEDGCVVFTGPIGESRKTTRTAATTFNVSLPETVGHMTLLREVSEGDVVRGLYYGHRSPTLLEHQSVGTVTEADVPAPPHISEVMPMGSVYGVSLDERKAYDVGLKGHLVIAEPTGDGAKLGFATLIEAKSRVSRSSVDQAVEKVKAFMNL